MIVREIVLTCSNPHVARAAVLSIGGDFARRFSRDAAKRNLTSGVFAAGLVRRFSRQAADGDWEGVGHAAQGAALLVECRANGLAARWLYPAYYVCAEGELAGDADSELALHAAFERGGIEFIKSLRWREPIDVTRCWYAAKHWGLSYDPLDEV